MSGTVGVSVVPVLGGVLDVGHIDGDSSVPLLGRVINLVVILEFGQLAVARGEHLRVAILIISVSWSVFFLLKFGFISHNSILKEWESPTFVMAAVRVVLPWSTCPMVPILQCGLSRLKTSFCSRMQLVERVRRKTGLHKHCQQFCRTKVVTDLWFRASARTGEVGARVDRTVPEQRSPSRNAKILMLTSVCTCKNAKI